MRRYVAMLTREGVRCVKNIGDAYMADRFQSMTIVSSDAVRG